MAFNIFGKKAVKKAVKKAPSKKPVKKKAVVKKSSPKQPAIQKSSEISISRSKYTKEKAFDLLKKSNIPTIPFLFAKNEKKIENNIDSVGYPCTLIGADREVIVSTKEDAIKEFKKLIRLKSVDEVFARKTINSAMEMMLLVKRDPSFGYIVSVNMGGQYKEIMKDVKFRICPITILDAEAMVRELQGFYLLQNKVNLESFYNLILKISSFAIKNEIDEIRIEKIVFDDKGSYVFDVNFS